MSIIVDTNECSSADLAIKHFIAGSETSNDVGLQVYIAGNGKLTFDLWCEGVTEIFQIEVKLFIAELLKDSAMAMKQK